MAPRKRPPRRVSRSAASEDQSRVPETAAPTVEEHAEDRSAPIAPSAFPVVGIGASAGGVSAFEAFFSAMPGSESGMALVLVQHLSPDHKSILSDLIRRYTTMRVNEVEDGMEIQPDNAYIIPPNRDMALEGNTLRLYEPGAPRGQRLPIDFFFRSLARERHERAICVVLSGTGSDGTLGLRAVKGEGGMAMAQDPDTTEHDGMPRSAIATGLVDYVLPPGDMPAQLIAYVEHAFGKLPPVTSPVPAGDSNLKALTTLLRNHTGHDFSQYKSTTLVRRMQRRMAIHQIENVPDYLRYARQSPSEVDSLFRDLLIGVTNFFRDPDAFKALEDHVIPRLFRARGSVDPIRVWVPGCSTGEEAYSIAILLQEHMQLIKRTQRVQVFATDIDSQAIERARAGVYPASIAADVSPERLARFFTHESEDSVFRVQKVIRDMVVFSEQDVIKDPPFSKLDLISCRNLLIYLENQVQGKLLPLFHYALQPGGVLFLGTSESVGEHSRLFTPIDRKWKLYQAQPVGMRTGRPVLGEFVPRPHEPPEVQLPVRRLDPAYQGRDLGRLAETALLAHYVEAGLLVNGRGDILHIVGRTGKYLEPASGQPELNVLAMAREGLRRPLTTALHKAVARRSATHFPGVRVATNGTEVMVDLTVRPAAVVSSLDGPGDLYLVVFKESVPSETTATDRPGSGPADQARVAELERELRTKEEYLQSTIEEMETTNEELKSTNEEMQSINEELQSTNEELETSKEELQSVNEELSTVNAELQDKVADLARSNNDMNNLLAGTGIGTLFVDHNLRISRFTPATTQVMNLISGDVGRPVDHVVSNLINYDRIVDDLRHVLDTLQPLETEVRSRSGTWFLLRMRPYRTLDNVIEGAVITFIDISERKRAEQALGASEARFQTIFNGVQVGLSLVDRSAGYLFANERQLTLLGYTVEELLQHRIQDVTFPEDLAQFQHQFDLLAGGGPDFQLKRRYRRKDGSALHVIDRISGIRDESDRVHTMLVVTFDLAETE